MGHITTDERGIPVGGSTSYRALDGSIFTHDLATSREAMDLDYFVDLMGFFVHAEEFAGYCRDQLCSGSGGLKAVRARCYDDRVHRKYWYHADAFAEEVQKVWDRVVSEFDPSKEEPIKTKLRKRVLVLLERHTKWMRQLDQYITGSHEMRICQKECMDLSEVCSLLSGRLVEMNSDMEPAVLARLNAMLPQYDQYMVILMGEVDTLLSKQQRAKNRRTGKDVKVSKL
ncbi:hypothetical protein KIPB_003394 [Kipferlia bialata]|uniref:Uncharacterized protein n=1 Tax=Kipferlia bialata TaxID=797122 RepID=A0A9K3GH14_9EUKA|nr:hypothetical protein KIPB_003080 [Kipferlia bialata]GIQ82287.1 hypothetical protein KIPB_003394 [Kipferlia bialata]|eukprot:g3080.t1